MTTPLLQAINLRCERDDRVLFEGLHLTVEPGTVTRIEGPNGAGKTTLLRMLCGLNSAFEGELLWRGQPLYRMREELHNNLLYLGHKSALKAVLSPLENLRAFMAPRRHCDEDQLFLALQAVGLEGFEDVPCHNLSAGQQRRAALARLYLSQAPLWVLDEAFTAIDVTGVGELEKLIAGRAEQGGAVIMTTHHRMAMPGLQRVLLGDAESGEVRVVKEAA
ncbi:cytochrome c biogenesis heme-transporting ATPase CcmA [Marinobacteraceae bacterium S3BR75-40.1]